MLKTRTIAIAFGFLLLAAAAARTQDSTPVQQPPAAPGAGRSGGQSQEGQRGRPPLFGKITAIHSDSIEITRADNTSATVKFSDKTQYRKDRQEAKRTDFKVGDMIFVRGEEDTDHTWTAEMIGSRSGGGPGGFAGQGGQMGALGTDFVVGEVKALDPPKITVLRPDNVTQTIELNEDTSLRRGQESVTMADIQPGDHIFARGGMQNGAFVPKMVNVISPEQWKRMQEMGFVPGGGQAPPRQPKSGSNPQ